MSREEYLGTRPTRRSVLVATSMAAVIKSLVADARAVTLAVDDTEGATELVQKAIDKGAYEGRLIDLSHRRIRISGLRFPTGTYVNLNGSTLQASSPSSPKALLEVCGRGITVVGDFILDLANCATRGLLITGSENVKITGHVRIQNCGTGEENSFSGGCLIQESKNIHLNTISALNVRQYRDRPGLYKAFAIRYSSYAYLGHLSAKNCDMGVDINNATDVNVNSATLSDLTDNALYLIGHTERVAIRALFALRVEEGVVLNCVSNAANVGIVTCAIHKASNKGVSLRTGGGYHFESLSLDGATIGESRHYAGVTRLSIERLIVSDTILLAPVIRMRRPYVISIDHLAVDNVSKEQSGMALQSLKAVGVQVNA